MVRWSKLWHVDNERSNKRRARDEAQQLLPEHSRGLPPSAVPPKEVTKVAMRLKYQIERVIPSEIEEFKVTKPSSPVITSKVVECAMEAGGADYKGCVVYCLLVCKRWFKKQAQLELWDSDLHEVRAIACEVIAKRIIEDQEDQEYLLQEVLLRRYSICRDGEESEPANVIERAVDLHALRIIGSSGYQKAVKYLWKGWIVQDDKDTGTFVTYKDRANTDYWIHFNPDRMRTPLYQNTVQILTSVVYLILYTGAVNTINEGVYLDPVEVILYIMTFGFICDELTKFWKVGRYYFSFWNAVNSCLYALLTISFVIRMMAFAHPGPHDDSRKLQLNAQGYYWFAFSAPMFWLRLLLNLDTFRFFGAMLVVLKVMMRESLIFFALLIVVCIGFLQGFHGLAQVENDNDITDIIQAMINSVMQSPEFDGFENYAPPFGVILYYIYTFVVMVILLNILIALYNSAYEDITDNAIDEYMALFAQKTMGYVRAPDENVFIPPFNLIEIFLLVLPFEWWMSDHRYERLNHYVMGVIYAPVLLATSFYEVRSAAMIRYNRRQGEEDDDTVEEWEQMNGEVDHVNDGWSLKVAKCKPDTDTDGDMNELQALKREIEGLKTMVRAISVEPEPSRS